MSAVPTVPVKQWMMTILAAVLLSPVALTGCGPGPTDAVYALLLDHQPTAADWERAVPLRREAVGGRTSRAGEGDVDADTVHKATASCHHGTKTSPVKVEVRSFYTAERLYLQVSWVDPTPNLGPSWRWDGSRWQAGGVAEDGLGVLWGGDPAEFSCVRTCHLEDWRMAGPRAFADYRMRVPAGASPLDFWVWRAGRGAVGGLAEDGKLGVEGWTGDGPGDLFAPNSVRAAAAQPDAFGPGDVPREAPDPEPGAVAPGYRLADHTPGRLEVEARSSRGRGAWQVTLSRTVAGEDPDDVRFVPGGEYAFGLAIFDGVEKDHTAVPAPIRLVLVDPSVFPEARAEE